MRKTAFIISAFLVLISSALKSQSIAGTYKIAGDSYSEGTLVLTQSLSDSTYSFSLSKKTSDCGIKSLTGSLSFNSKDIATYALTEDSCSLMFKRNTDVISIIVNCKNNLDYLCSFSGRFLLIK